LIGGKGETQNPNWDRGGGGKGYGAKGKEGGFVFCRGGGVIQSPEPMGGVGGLGKKKKFHLRI